VYSPSSCIASPNLRWARPHRPGRDESLFLAEWSGPDGCELDDWRAIAQANPALGHTVSPQAIKSALGTDPPNVYRTEVLWQGVDQLDGAVDRAAWRACADPTGSLEVRNRVVLCLDTSPALDHVTLAAAVLDDGRVRTEIVCGLGSTAAARAALPGWIERIKPRATGWFPSGPSRGIVR
jgi:hypothetical protein